jgi:hypothetical protein
MYTLESVVPAAAAFAVVGCVVAFLVRCSAAYSD